MICKKCHKNDTDSTTGKCWECDLMTTNYHNNLMQPKQEPIEESQYSLRKQFAEQEYKKTLEDKDGVYYEKKWPEENIELEGIENDFIKLWKEDCLKLEGIRLKGILSFIQSTYLLGKEAGKKEAKQEAERKSYNDIGKLKKGDRYFAGNTEYEIINQ